MEKAARRRPRSSANTQAVVEAVRAQHLARNDSTVNEGFVAISTPVFDHTGGCAAITLIGPAGLRNDDNDGQNGRALTETVTHVSRLLGF